MRRPDVLAAVLFDLDGVLIDSGKAWYRVICRGVEKMGGEAPGWEAFHRTFGQGPAADQAEFFRGWSVAQVERFYDETFPEELEAIETLSGAHEVLTALRDRGVARAVVTNTPHLLAERVLEVKGLIGLLDTYAASGQAPEKPAPDLIYLALERLGLKKDQVVYVGDSPSDRAATRAAGVYMLGLGIDGDHRLGVLSELLDFL